MAQPYRPFQPTLTPLGLKRHGLSLVTQPPSPALCGVVQAYLQIHASDATPYPVIPDGTHAIYLSRHGAFLVGAQSRAMDIEIQKPGDYFGIWFFPGTLRHFVDIDVSEIKNTSVNETDISWDDFACLSEKIYQYSAFEDRATVCDQWLMTQFNAHMPTKFEHAMDLIYQSDGNLRVSTLAKRVGWSARHLNRMLSLHTGFSTKEFSQIVRLQHACKQIWRQGNLSTNTSMELGYFDQSHLIKQWHKHLGMTPGALWRRLMSDFYNH